MESLHLGYGCGLRVTQEGSSLTPRDGFLLALPKPAGSQLNQGPVGNPGEGELLRGL